MKRLIIKIHGKVQGVFFRASAREKAEQLGIKGWSMNNSDGTVSIEAEGQREALEKFLDWCYTGPDRAEVDKIDFSWTDELKNYDVFETRWLQGGNKTSLKMPSGNQSLA